MFGDKKLFIGRISKVLKISRVGFIDSPLRWKWKRVLFRKFRLNLEKEINRHMLIIGESGSGKSNACKLILKQLSSEGANFIVFDPHNEYVGSAKDTGSKVYDALYNKINLFELDGVTVKEKVGELATLFRKVFRLGEVQYTLLYKCIGYTYNVSLRKGKKASIAELLYTINIFMKNARGPKELNTLSALKSRLSLLSNGGANEISISDVLWKRSIFAMSSLHTSEAQAIYIEGLLRKIYANMSLRKGEKPFYIVVDEAEKLESSNIIARLAAEGRKYGIGIIAIAQRAKSVTSSIRSNASVVIAFYQKEPEELNYISNMIAAGNELNRFIEVKKALRSLHRGSAIVERNGTEPIIVSFYRFNESVNVEQLALEAAKGVANREEIADSLKGAGIDEREFERVINSLVSEGRLFEYKVTQGKYAGMWYATSVRNSAEHDIMVALISKELGDEEIPNVVYNSTNGPDIIAYREGKRIAIEYETGKKETEETLNMLTRRKEEFGYIIVVVNDDKLNEYESNLQRLGVLRLGASQIDKLKEVIEKAIQ